MRLPCLLQTIYGQCLSLADLFCADDAFEAFLFVPAVVDKTDYGEIEAIFASVVVSSWSAYCNQMGIAKPIFRCPDFAHTQNGPQSYGDLGSGENRILVTNVVYGTHLTSD